MIHWCLLISKVKSIVYAFNDQIILSKLLLGLPTKAVTLVKRTMVQILSHSKFYSFWGTAVGERLFVRLTKVMCLHIVEAISQIHNSTNEGIYMFVKRCSFSLSNSSKDFKNFSLVTCWVLDVSMTWLTLLRILSDCRSVVARNVTTIELRGTLLTIYP